jgi:hypothetical protein
MTEGHVKNFEAKEIQVYADTVYFEGKVENDYIYCALI